MKETRRTLSKPMKRLQKGYSYSIILAIEFSPNECDENLLMVTESQLLLTLKHSNRNDGLSKEEMNEKPGK